jgi:sigma-B regulation protein RsbU (phosphoserine phosphatase)
METAGALQVSFDERLLVRRERLVAALSGDMGGVDTAPLEALIGQVDEALARLEEGSFGVCETCGDAVEVDRLACDPLLRFCLDHLSASERRAFEHDLDTATRIQRALLPPPDLAGDGWRLRFDLRPAGPVSGDFCVLAPAAAGEALPFVFGDASGKGVAGSMLVSQLHAIFRGLFATASALASLVADANRIFCESTPGSSFATAVAVRLAPDGEVELVNAGHPSALLRTADGAVRHLDSGGLPLGMFSDGCFAVRKLRMNAADTLLLYTDGLSEATDEEGCEHGVARLAERFAEIGGLEPGELTAALVKDLADFRGEGVAHDDLALMVVRREG